MDDLIKVGLFLLGAIFSVILVPFIEKKKSDFLREQSRESLWVELEDIQNELNEHIEQHFQFLVNLRTQSELASSGKLPVPMPREINAEVLFDLYNKSSTILTSSQRVAIKRIPSSLSLIMNNSQSSIDSVLEQQTYCIQSVKNTIKLSCRLVFEINLLRQEKDRFKKRDELNSNSATSPVLRSLGFSESQIQTSRIEESQFNDLNVEM
ncbi:hypothetical protein NB502_14370 [Vibrio diabolicus]|uniref:hypothetical protein n=1 Tax=Vibrio harveyi group TaxID=717610 RepID=UPI000A3CFE1F|nr:MULTISPECIES: hypothetical protein [Vibrio harveyi group]EGS6764481.1 hypothetical protein [Vibrio parahaemolyticus]EGY8744502.1 hypothetical protein [Vibrio parahaemolyticus]EHE6936413.1 hypothetical protein [Vibrio parahaemolyticus]MBM4937121.1 hypothetical protein [Vibrio parahaemolyticus]MCR9473042.1 hypothetical protein [Vibrio diabolicus]